MPRRPSGRCRASRVAPFSSRSSASSELRAAPVNIVSLGAICLPMIRILSHSPAGASRARGVHLACELQETILVAPDEEDLEQLQFEVAALRLALHGELHEVGGLVVKTIGHVEVGFGQRVARLQCWPDRRPRACLRPSRACVPVPSHARPAPRQRRQRRCAAGGHRRRVFLRRRCRHRAARGAAGVRDAALRMSRPSASSRSASAAPRSRRRRWNSTTPANAATSASSSHQYSIARSSSVGPLVRRVAVWPASRVLLPAPRGLALARPQVRLRASNRWPRARRQLVWFPRRRHPLRGYRCRTALQRRKLGVAHLQQAACLGQLCLELLDAGIDIRRGRWRWLEAAAGGTAVAVEGAACALLRRHESQAAGVGRGRGLVAVR